MTPAKIKILRRLKKILPGEIFLEPALLKKYAGDKWFAAHQPDAAALPRSTKSVATILRFANQHRIPVTPRGAGHGYVGGCVPVRGGIVLSLERMNRIKEINAADFVAVVQPGVNTEEIPGSRRAARPLLSARSREPREQFHRRQHRHQRRRPALPQIRRHPRLRPRPRSRAGRRHHRPRSAGARTKTKPASICTGCSSARKACSASSPRRR
jgi:hypothetical protein